MDLLPREKRVVLNVLKRLKKSLEHSREARIEFASTVLENGVYQEVISHEYFERYGISGRDFDTCFEMNDGSEVVAGIMERAKDNPALERGIRSTGADVWDIWSNIAVKVSPQQQVLDL